MESCFRHTHSDPVNNTTLRVENDRLRTDISSGRTYSFHPERICNGTKHSWRILLFASGLGFKTVLIPRASSCTISIILSGHIIVSGIFHACNCERSLKLLAMDATNRRHCGMDEFTKFTYRTVKAYGWGAGRILSLTVQKKRTNWKWSGEVNPARGLFDGPFVFRPFATDRDRFSTVPTWAQAA